MYTQQKLPADFRPTSDTETSGLEQATNRYGLDQDGNPNISKVLPSAQAYRKANPELFPEAEDFEKGIMASPRIDDETMSQKFPITRKSFKEAGKGGGTSQAMEGIEVAASDYGDQNEINKQHETIHRTDFLKYPGVDLNKVNQQEYINSLAQQAKTGRRDLLPVYKSLPIKVGKETIAPTHSNYLMTRKEINARLPRLNSMHMSTGGAFPTSAEEGAKVFANFGLTKGDVRPKLQERHQFELDRNPDVKEWIDSVWKMPRDQREKLIDERAIRQPGQVKNSPQKKPLDAVV